MTIASIAAFFLICGGWAFFAKHYPNMGWDFSQFYIAASLPIDSLYDRAAYELFAKTELAPLGVNYYPPYVRPAVFALPMKLLAPLSYRSAEGLFFAMQFVLYLVTLWLSFRRFHLPHHLLPAFALFQPAMLGIITGQDPHTLTLLIFSGFLLLEGDHDVAAGLVWSLCLYKFNLVLGLPLLLLLRARWKALGAFAAGGVALASASIALAPASEYLTLLGNIEAYTVNFTPEQMIGLRRLAHAANMPLLYPATALVVLGLSVRPIQRAPLPAAFTIAVLGSALCSYHVNWYDAAILTPCFVHILAEKRSVLRFVVLALVGVVQLWELLQWVACGLLLLWAGVISSFRTRNAARGAAA